MNNPCPYRVFGSRTHQYAARPRLTKAELEAFEVGQGITLPAEYAEWLTWFGNGGVGPDNGLYPLGDWDLVYGQRLKAGRLDQPFPYTEPWMPLTADETDRDGTITLSWSGEYEHFLIVSGPCAGEVWVDDRSEDGGLYPAEAQGLRLSFYDWIDSWITRAFRELNGG